MDGPPQQESSQSTCTLAPSRDIIAERPLYPLTHGEARADTKLSPNFSSSSATPQSPGRETAARRRRREDTVLPSPELESQLPSFPPHPVSERFMSTLEQNRLHHPRLYARILCNAVTLLRDTSQHQLFFALDHCTISNGYDVIPPNEPILCDSISSINIIRRGNIQFILMALRQILPSLQCSHLVKQSFEEICEEWINNVSKMASHYADILDELNVAFETFF